jgi:hypothetical protein
LDLGDSDKGEEISRLAGEKWSAWLDFNRETISTIVPEEPGLFKVHASMKILYIGIAQNLKATIINSILDPCVGKGQRFSYMVNHGPLESLKTELLKDYTLRHNGSMPACMESVAQ